MDIIENIRIFRRLAAKGSFSSVAQEMGTSQPTISRAIKMLEIDLGVSLFRRTTRGLSLTTEGQNLLQQGNVLLDQLDVLFATVKNEKLLLKGSLRVSSSLAFSRLIMAPLLSTFTKIHPELKLDFQLSDGYVNIVEEGIDVAIRHGEQEDSTLRAIKIGNTRRALYASVDYLKENGKPKSIDDLKKHRLLYYNRISDRPAWPFLERDGTPRTFYFEPHLQSDGSDLIREALILGEGIAYTPTWMMIQPEKEKKIVRLLEAHTSATIPVYVVTPAAQEMTVKQRAMADFLKKQFVNYPELSIQ